MDLWETIRDWFTPIDLTTQFRSLLRCITHTGNASYLKHIEARELEYLYLESRTEKTEYAKKFVRQLRKEGIRFLKKEDHGKVWYDVGDTKMREKVSQNLRERQPQLKKKIAEQQQQETARPQQNQQRMSTSSPPQEQRETVVGNMGMIRSMQPNSPMRPNEVYSSHQNNPAVPPNNFNNMDSFLLMQAMATRNQQEQQLVMQQMMALQHHQQQLLQQRQQGASMGRYSSNSNDAFACQVPTGMELYGNNRAIINNNNNANFGSFPLSDFELSEMAILQGMQADNHSLNPMPLNRGISTATELLSPEEEWKLRAAEEQPLPGGREDGNGRPNMMLRGRSTDFGLPINDVLGMDCFAGMGASTTSLLGTLEVEPVPEEGETEGDLSPTPTQTTIGTTTGGDGPFTPVLSDRRSVPPLTRGNVGPATVSPTPNFSPRANEMQHHPHMERNVLDDDIIQGWASVDGDDGPEAFMPLPQPSKGENPRVQSHQHGGYAKRASVPARRVGTAPVMSSDCDLSPRPGILSIDKRATSNVAETPETRGHLVHREQGLQADMFDFDSYEPSSAHSSSSSFSVKKASLGRDKSEQSRLLKQQFMPKAFASNRFTSAGCIDAINSTSDGNLTGAGLLSTANDPLTPLTKSGGTIVTGHLHREFTPRTYGMMQDFGKLSVLSAAAASDANQSITISGSSRTATSFEDTFGCR
jgi:hypothetical protein